MVFSCTIIDSATSRSRKSPEQKLVFGDVEDSIFLNRDREEGNNGSAELVDGFISLLDL